MPPVFPWVPTSPRNSEKGADCTELIDTAVSSSLTCRKLETSDVIIDEVASEIPVSTSMSDIESNVGPKNLRCHDTKCIHRPRSLHVGKDSRNGTGN